MSSGEGAKRVNLQRGASAATPEIAITNSFVNVTNYIAPR